MNILLYEVIEPSGIWYKNIMYRYGSQVYLNDQAAKYPLINGDIRVISSSNAPLPEVVPQDNNAQYLVIKHGDSDRYIPIEVFISRIASAMGSPVTSAQSQLIAHTITLGYI